MTEFRLTLMCVLMLAIAAVFVTGCQRSSTNEVVVYVALDREFSAPILAAFTEDTGIQVRAKYDLESNKTVGLTNLIIAEKDRPRCDLFWNNEILNTLRLEKAGLLGPYHPVNAESFPERFRAADGAWHGFAARARVLLVNTELVAENERPDSILDLTDPRWQGKVGIAKPLFGTTATHAACLFAEWGDEKASRFFEQVKQNGQVLAGNRPVAQAVGSGQLAFGLTDTDDALIELENGQPVEIIFPDQGDGQMGTLFIPNTLAIIRDGPNPNHASALVEYLLSAEVEAELARARSGQIPLNPQVETKSRVMPSTEVRSLDIDFDSAADAWSTTAERLRDLFTNPE